MSTDVQALLQRDHHSLGRAAGDYVRAMDASEILKHLDAAATKALYSGDGAAAWVIRGVINGPNAYGEYLRDAAAVLLRDKPEYLKHFGTDFTKGVAGRLN